MERPNLWPHLIWVRLGEAISRLAPLPAAAVPTTLGVISKTRWIMSKPQKVYCVNMTIVNGPDKPQILISVKWTKEIHSPWCCYIELYWISLWPHRVRPNSELVGPESEARLKVVGGAKVGRPTRVGPICALIPKNILWELIIYKIPHVKHDDDDIGLYPSRAYKYMLNPSHSETCMLVAKLSWFS